MFLVGLGCLPLRSARHCDAEGGRPVGGCHSGRGRGGRAVPSAVPTDSRPSARPRPAVPTVSQGPRLPVVGAPAPGPGRADHADPPSVSVCHCVWRPPC